MKIKQTNLSYNEVVERKARKIKSPKRPMFIWRLLIKLLSFNELRQVHFKCNKINMDKLKRKEPCLILMNHSNFLDMKIAHKVLFPRCFNIVATTDGFVGRNWLMREIGCIPTVKFITDPGLVRNIANCIKKKRSVLMYPEAGYSMDGTSTTLPFTLAKLVKFLKVPLVTIITKGGYLRQPLYGNLDKRKVDVSCDLKYVLSKDEIASMTEQEIFQIILDEFSFNNFEDQINNKTEVTESFRARYLNKVLYKCPHCMSEGKMNGHDTILECEFCKKVYELSVTGELIAKDGVTEYNTVPKWYKFERDEVRKEIDNGTYLIDVDVDVIVMKDTYNLYHVGSGHLTHSIEGYHLTLDDGSLEYHHLPTTSYSVNVDLHWYQIGDLVCIGDYNIQYYCFPKVKDTVVKMRLATEEIYKILKSKNMK